MNSYLVRTTILHRTFFLIKSASAEFHNKQPKDMTEHFGEVFSEGSFGQRWHKSDQRHHDNVCQNIGDYPENCPVPHFDYRVESNQSTVQNPEKYREKNMYDEDG